MSEDTVVLGFFKTSGKTFPFLSVTFLCHVCVRFPCSHSCSLLAFLSVKDIYSVIFNPSERFNPFHFGCISVNMPVCLALLNLLLLIVNSVVLLCANSFCLHTTFSSAGLWGVDPLTPEVVMNFTRENVYAGCLHS